MNPYPVLTKLDDVFMLSGQQDGRYRLWAAHETYSDPVFLTPAEVLALADELKAFVAAQTHTTAMAELPSGDPT